jgi:hypothetical protein
MQNVGEIVGGEGETLLEEKNKREKKEKAEMRTGGFGRDHERGEGDGRPTRVQEGGSSRKARVIRSDLSYLIRITDSPARARFGGLSSHKTAHTLWALTYNRVPCPQLSGTDFTIFGTFHLPGYRWRGS